MYGSTRARTGDLLWTTRCETDVITNYTTEPLKKCMSFLMRHPCFCVKDCICLYIRACRGGSMWTDTKKIRCESDEKPAVGSRWIAGEGSEQIEIESC